MLDSIRRCTLYGRGDGTELLPCGNYRQRWYGLRGQSSNSEPRSTKYWTYSRK
jgi:hypothetical protein